jgi:hypothetical protein
MSRRHTLHDLQDEFDREARRARQKASLPGSRKSLVFEGLLVAASIATMIAALAVVTPA